MLYATPRSPHLRQCRVIDVALLLAGVECLLVGRIEQRRRLKPARQVRIGKEQRPERNEISFAAREYITRRCKTKTAVHHVGVVELLAQDWRHALGCRGRIDHVQIADIELVQRLGQIGKRRDRIAVGHAIERARG